MNERERILDLVKQGILSSEEALVLLENLAKKSVTNQPADDKAADEQPEAEAETTVDQTEQALSDLNTRIATVSGNLDALSEQIRATHKQVAANEEQIIVLDTMEDLDTLTQEKYQERGRLKQENLQLNQQLTDLTQQQESLKSQLSELEQEQRQLTKQRIKVQVLGGEWQDQARDTLNDLGKTMGDATNQIGHIVKSTMSTVLDNVDWKDITIKVPGLATERFSHTFDFPESAATILDLKVANGDVTFKPWDQSGFRVEANIKLYGKMQAESPLAAFMERSRIDVTDDHFIFQVPNKRVQADLVVYLPDREYDHTTIRSLNGNINLDQVHGKDFYLKNTNGDIQLNNVQMVMLEAQGVNGSIKLIDGGVHDAFLETVNGDIKLKTTPVTAQLQTVNGTIRSTYTGEFKVLNASSVNGNVKLALPESIGLSGAAKTRFGSVKSRLSGVSVPTKSPKQLELTRAGDPVGELTVTTTSGNIQLKNTDEQD